MTPMDQITQLLRDTACAAAALADPASSRAEELAGGVLALIVGTDDGEPCGEGLLDRYELRTSRLEDGPPRRYWHCSRGHNGDGPWAGIICRDLDWRQDGVTLGEFVRCALQHEAEEHTGLEGGDDA